MITSIGTDRLWRGVGAVDNTAMSWRFGSCCGGNLAVTVPLAAAVYSVVLALPRTFNAGGISLLASLISNKPLAPIAGSGNDHGGYHGD